MADAQQYFNSQIVGKVNEIYDYHPTVGSDGDLTRLSGINVLINSLRTLLLTPLGYYPFDPEFGSLLYKMLFEPSDKITQQAIEYEVTNRVLRYDPRIRIQTIQFSYSPDKKTISVNVIILRGTETGKVNAILTQQQSMFGAEDSVTAVNDKSSSAAQSGSGTASIIISIFNNNPIETDFINAMKVRYPLMSLSMIMSYWKALSKT